MKTTKQPRAADSAPMPAKARRGFEKINAKAELIRAHLDACVDIDETRLREPERDARTPGEWYWTHSRRGDILIAVQDGNSSPLHIATVHSSDEHGRISGDNLCANGKLIAAAPKLLAAVVAANAIFARMDDDTDRVTRADIEAAWNLVQDALNAANGDAP